MNKEEIRFFKHSLKDYYYLSKQVRELSIELDYILEQKHYITLKSKSIVKPSKDNHQYESVYSSREFYELLRREERCKYLIDLYSKMMANTNRMINQLDEPVKSILLDIYKEGISPEKVARKYYYSDEKSMYRMIRNSLKKD